ncbi:MAG: hypothetical protein GX802_02145, partial [Clostridiales bacterium]|nr:hypothetical protein [Clostridiales bacterium]
MWFGAYSCVIMGMRENDVDEPCEELATQWLNECGLIYNQGLCEFDTIQKMFPWMAESSVRGVQRAISEMDYQNVLSIIIEAPMGEGKTEAALYATQKLCCALGRDGLYTALPTKATGNQMYNRVNELFTSHEMDGARLLHGTAWIVETKNTIAFENELTEESEEKSLW